ncbi:hypothetical protein L21_0854 [Methanoculleus chikugoensis]|uniref:Lipoprotein n=1 Tax=Methanoculleus chikugoensis TaxID=118126 RepID=A0A1M4MJD4_9EURY|nr:hypothetical protein [Methanoculleus chikugoensis]NMA10093.1 hypothetical protein [Methanomicrobiales archaeon]SCL74967.1 hypothetical protein L21_0854 [Methanoculleus chikugoensis]
MKRIFILSLTLLLLALGAGCIDFPGANATENATSPPVLHYERENVSIPINTSEIPVRTFDVNATEVIEIVLADQRAGILLEGGWQITSIRTGFEGEDPNREHIDVEFRNDELSLSFFIEVDEWERQTGRGRCSATIWRGHPWTSEPFPEEEDYHQAVNPYMGLFVVVDHHNERVIMAYDDTTIFYLYPSYGEVTEWE